MAPFTASFAYIKWHALHENVHVRGTRGINDPFFVIEQESDGNEVNEAYSIRNRSARSYTGFCNYTIPFTHGSFNTLPPIITDIEVVISRLCSRPGNFFTRNRITRE